MKNVRVNCKWKFQLNVMLFELKTIVFVSWESYDVLNLDSLVINRAISYRNHMNLHVALKPRPYFISIILKTVYK